MGWVGRFGVLGVVVRSVDVECDKGLGVIVG